MGVAAVALSINSPRVFIAVRDVAGEACVGHMSHYAHPPGDLDRVLAHILHRAVAAHVEQVGLEVLTVSVGLPTH